MSTPKAIAQAITANLRTGITPAFGHVYSGMRVRPQQPWPVAMLNLIEQPAVETRYTMKGIGEIPGKKRILYRPRLTVLWPQQENLSSDDGADTLAVLDLIESVKASLRIHTSLGGLVLKCAEDEIAVRATWEPQNVPLWTLEFDFTVLDEINAVPQG
ncbi:MAG: hypothetical protein M3O91_07485 [Chloroflexota bacterium]|nr:hypothetical protein [Chloroflexota bacterium]